MAHWPRVRLTTLLAAISSRFESTLERNCGLKSRHSGVESERGGGGGGGWRKEISREKKKKERKRKDIEREEISRRSLAAISGKLNSGPRD